MKNFIISLIFLITAALYLNAQDSFADTGLSYPSTTSQSYEETATDEGSRFSENTEKVLNEITTVNSENSESEQNIPEATEEGKRSVLSHVQWGATVDMQVDKEMWDEFGEDMKNRLQYASLTHWYRKVADDFWLRVALRAKYSHKYFESAFSLRFYPYWTMRRKGDFQTGNDLNRYLDVLEINQAYLKTFKNFGNEDRNFGLHFKVGRDGLLSTGSQLFGNYLELPTAGYGESRNVTVVGPFKNRKVFANQLEIGLNFKFGDFFSGTTSLMLGGNVNNKQWYSAPTPPISEEMDSKLSAGFTRGYQDFYFWKERIHLGAGFRVYTTKATKTEPVVTIDEEGLAETTSTSFPADSRFINGDWTFDITILPDCKFYSEFGFQKLGFRSIAGVVRPFTAGITIPTGGILDILAVEIENVSNTFFSDVSRRDPVGNRKDTRSFAWGIVIDKWFIKERAGISWGVYTGNAYGDMKTSLRLTSNF